MRIPQASLGVADVSGVDGGTGTELVSSLHERAALIAKSADPNITIERAAATYKLGCHLWWYRCLARAGVVAMGATAGRRMHWSRHTAIQRIVDKTGNIRLAQDVAGHSSIAVTEGYTRASATTQAEEMRKVLA